MDLNYLLIGAIAFIAGMSFDALTRQRLSLEYVLIKIINFLIWGVLFVIGSIIVLFLSAVIFAITKVWHVM